jgi:hypothetical protein
MENKEKKSVYYYMRLLHRYAGFFIFGFVILYGLSGITLIYRDTDFLKKEKIVSLKLAPGINQSELGSALRMREFKVEKTEGDIIYFKGGSYNTVTGSAEQTVKDLVFPFNKLTNLHKTPSKNALHWFTLTFGIVMLFLAISSLWMYKPGSVLFRKSMIFTAAGVIFAIVLLFFIK